MLVEISQLSSKHININTSNKRVLTVLKHTQPFFHFVDKPQGFFSSTLLPLQA